MGRSYFIFYFVSSYYGHSKISEDYLWAQEDVGLALLVYIVLNSFECFYFADMRGIDHLAVDHPLVPFPHLKPPFWGLGGKRARGPMV